MALRFTAALEATAKAAAEQPTDADVGEMKIDKRQVEPPDGTLGGGTSQERKRARVDGASATDGGGVSAAAAHPLPQAGPELAEEAPPGTAEVASRTSAAKVPEGAAKSTARKPPPRTLAILAGGGTVIYTPAQYISFGITHTKYNGGHLSGSAAYG
jgi:hypothetical protein